MHIKLVDFAIKNNVQQDIMCLSLNACAVLVLVVHHCLVRCCIRITSDCYIDVIALVVNGLLAVTLAQCCCGVACYCTRAYLLLYGNG